MTRKHKTTETNRPRTSTGFSPEAIAEMKRPGKTSRLVTRRRAHIPSPLGNRSAA